MNEINDLINVFNLLIPEGTDEELVINGFNVTLSKKNGETKIKVENIDNTKDIVKEYKENIKDLDDSLFLDVLEEIKKDVDIKEFNRLLELDKFNKEESSKVKNIIYSTSNVICDKLQEKINELEDLYDKFSR